MTPEEQLLSRLKTLDASSLYEIVVYITPERKIGFWVVKKEGKTEEAKSDKIAVERIAVNV